MAMFHSAGNIVTLNMIKLSMEKGSIVEVEGGSDDFVMKCSPSPGCVPVDCTGPACKDIDNQFQIIKNDETDTKRTLRGGNTVLLRSIRYFSHWLDCTDAMFCKITECEEDNDSDMNNASYVSTCAKHRFKIDGVGRTNKVLNVNNSLQFKSVQNDAIYKCNRKKCYTGNPRCSPFSPDTNCWTDRFKAHKVV